MDASAGLKHIKELDSIFQLLQKPTENVISS